VTARAQAAAGTAARPPAAGPAAARPAEPALAGGELEVEALRGYDAFVGLSDAQGGKPNAALLEMAFLDADGARLPGPYFGLAYSKQRDCYFAYAASGDTAGAGPAATVWAPQGACRLRWRLHRRAGSGELALDGPPRFAPHVYDGPELDALEAWDPAAARVAAAESLAARPGDAGILLHAMEAALRSGDDAGLREYAGRIAASAAAAGRIRAKARLAMGMLDELRTDWLPAVAGMSFPRPGGTAAARRGAVLRVLHLCADGQGEEAPPASSAAFELARRQRKAGMAPSLAVPAEYAGCLQPSSPWRKERRDGVDIFRLDCLSAQAVRGIARARLLEFESLLCAHIAARAGAAVLHAHAGRRGYDLALRALAVGRYLDVPVVCEYEPGRERLREDGQGEWPEDAGLAGLRRAQQMRCLKEAAAVIVHGRRDKSRLVRLGLDGDRIHVIARRARAGQEPLETLYRAAYRQALQSARRASAG